jgi:hypothetical protein
MPTARQMSDRSIGRYRASFASICPECGEIVESKWVAGGGCLPSPREYQLVADWVYHAPCWDIALARLAPSMHTGEK